MATMNSSNLTYHQHLCEIGIANKTGQWGIYAHNGSALMEPFPDEIVHRIFQNYTEYSFINSTILYCVTKDWLRVLLEEYNYFENYGHQDMYEFYAVRVNYLILCSVFLYF